MFTSPVVDSSEDTEPEFDLDFIIEPTNRDMLLEYSERGISIGYSSIKRSNSSSLSEVADEGFVLYTSELGLNDYHE